MKKRLTLLLGCLLLATALYSQDTNRIREHINKLSSPDMHGRGYAYGGDSIAAQYLIQQFEDLGVESFTQEYDFDVYAMEGPVTASLNGLTLKPWEEFAIAPYSHSANGHYNLLRVSPQTLLSQDELDHFCKKNKSKLKNSLLYVNMDDCRTEEERKQLNKQLSLISAYNGTWSFMGLVVGVQEIPVWSFNNAHKSCDFIVTYVKSKLIDKKTRTIDLAFTNELRTHKARNVIGIIPGTHTKDSIIVIGGHYDHLGQMGDAVIFPGAHDNASGVATVLEMAHHFQENPLNCTIYCVLFSGEEAGLLGSSAFVKNPPIDLSRVKFMLNLDLLCGGDDGITVVNSDAKGTADFFNSLVEINETEKLIATVKPRKNAANSDHYPFVAKDIPAVFIYVMGGKTGGYHQPDDTSKNASLHAFPGIYQLLIKGLESIQ